MEIDLHGFELWEAKEEVLYFLEEYQVKGIREVKIVHGYHRGQVLKRYFQSEKFLKDMKNQGIILIKKSNSNQGETCFELKND